MGMYSGQIVNFPVGVAAQTFEPLWTEGSVDVRRLLKWRNSAVTKLLEIRGAEEVYADFVRAVNAAAAEHPNAWFAKANPDKWKAVQEVYREFVPKFMADSVDMYLCGLREEYPSRGAVTKVKCTPWIEFVDTTTNPEYRPKHVWEEDLESCPLM